MPISTTTPPPPPPPPPPVSTLKPPLREDKVVFLSKINHSPFESKELFFD
jgi:hypothetical protein